MSTENSQPAIQRPRLPKMRSWRSVAILIPFLVLFVALSIGSGPFLTPDNLLNILDQQSATLIIAAAGTLVLISGGLDLSVGATYALAGVVSAQVALAHGVAAGVLAALAVGIVVGLVNGVVSTLFRINSLIATPAMSFIVSGVASSVSGGNLIVLTNEPSFAAIAQTDFLGVRTSIWIAVAVLLVLGFMLARTTNGRYLYAAGGNAEAARLAGIRVHGVRIMAFTLSGAAAALGGVIDTSRVLSAQSSSGSALTFTVLAGIVVGGTSILGGEGAIWRTIVGVLFIALVGNGFDLLGINALYQQIALGVILLLAVGIDAWSRVLRR
jgi:ribose transport system permease protein